MVTTDGVEDGFVFFAVLGGEVHTDLGVTAFGFVVHGFADVVEESGAACESSVETELVGDDLGEVGDFDGVLEDILAVGGAVGELAHGFDDLWMEAFEFEFHRGVFAGFDDFFVDLGADFFGDFFDAGGVHSAVGDEAFEGFDGDGLADLVEAGDDDDSGGVVDDDVGAGGFFEGSDVSAFAADDSAFEVVGGDGDGADGGFGGVLVGVSLDRVDEDLAGFVLGAVLGFFDDFAGDLAHFASGAVGDAFEEEFFGLGAVELGDAFEFVLLFFDQFVELGVAGFELGLALVEFLGSVGEGLFTLGEGFVFAVDEVFSFGETAFGLSEICASGFELFVGFFLAGEGLAFGFDDDFFAC